MTANSGSREQRIAPRRKVFVPATLRDRGETHRCHLLDVSRSGAKLHCAAPLRPNAAVICHIDNLIVRARVIWATEQRAGVAFHIPLVDRQLDAIAR